jgi:hypothetical protein
MREKILSLHLILFLIKAVLIYGGWKRIWVPIPGKVSMCSGGKRPPVPRITVQAFRRKPSSLIGA